MSLSSRRLTRAGVALLVAGLAGAPLALGAAPAQAAAGFTLPAVKHVWVIQLENKAYNQAFANNTNSYLASQLPAQGALLRKFYGTGHLSLDNYISQLSGQAPNADTQGDCQVYKNVTPGTPYDGPTTSYNEGQVVGQGCVYPAAVKTLPDQLVDHGMSWKGYMEDMGFDPSREQSICGVPNNTATGGPGDPTGAGTPDDTQGAKAADQYAARHNPFLYFHSILDSALCKTNVVPLVTKRTGGVDNLAKDLASVGTTPNFSFITPNLCNDAHDATCAGPNATGSSDDMTSHQGGLFAADAFLKIYVPEIMRSAAYQQDGMIIVTLDESGDNTATACCNEPTGPNTAMPGQTGPGGGQIGTVVLSPFVRPGTVSDVPYNHYSFLRSMEDVFRLGTTATIPGGDGQGHLGYAAMPGLVPFGPDVYSAANGPDPVVPEVPLALLLPLSAVGVGAAALALGRRRARVKS